MKNTLLSLILLACPLMAFAETPEERAELYFADVQRLDFDAAVGHYDPDGLREFREEFSFYKELPAQQQAQFIQTFFGPMETVESVRKLSDQAFFAAIFKFVMRQAEAAGGLNFDELEILGGVPEGDDVRHLVTRNRVSVGEIQVEAMEVVSLKQHGEEWRILMSGKLKGMADQMKAALGV